MEGTSSTPNAESDAKPDWEIEKRAQLAATLQWVDDNYEWSEGVCVPRCVLYQHYQDFCYKSGFISVGPATFGKIIRQRFPKLTTRRLGTRGQSRYHYYGIGIKQTSSYYKQTYSGTGLSRFSRVHVKTDGSVSGRRPSCSSNINRSGSLLPDFPQLSDLQINNTEIDLEKVKTFLIMYRTHCQRILDAIVTANFQEVENLLLHFWSSMPENILLVLGDESLSKLVAACDHILYKIINDVLIPSSFHEIPDREISTFIHKFPVWLESSILCCPLSLNSRKTEVAVWFVMSMKRHLSFIRLAQICRSFLCNSESTRQMVRDLNAVDIANICVQFSSIWKHKSTTFTYYTDKLIKYYDSFIFLLIKQAPFEDFLEWIDEVIDNYLCMDDPNSYLVEIPSTKVTSKFLLCWSYLVSLVIRDLTLHNSTSFGLIHVFNLMLNEYVYLVMETQRIRHFSQAMRNDVINNCLKSGCRFSMSLIGLEATPGEENPNNQLNITQTLDNNHQVQDTTYPDCSSSTTVYQENNWIESSTCQEINKVGKLDTTDNESICHPSYNNIPCQSECFNVTCENQSNTHLFMNHQTNETVDGQFQTAHAFSTAGIFDEHMNNYFF